MAHFPHNRTEKCWFCDWDIYREEGQKATAPVGVPVDQELQKAYIFCRQPVETRPFSHPTLWSSATKRAHPKCRDQAKLWIETGATTPAKLGQKVKNFWEMSPQEQQAFLKSFKKL